MTIIHTPAITYPTILIAVFARQLCLPIPAVLFLITAGALAAGGSLNLPTVILTSVVGCLLADYAWFIAGRWWGHRIVRALCTFSMNGQNYSRRARQLFARWGLRSLMIAKFVPGMDSLMPPLAGMLNVTSVLFLLFDAAGAFFWSAGYCSVGYMFAGHLDVVTTALGRAHGILAIVLAGVLCYLMWRAWELLHTMSQLRRITPGQLQEELGAGKKVMVLDLLNVEGQEDANNCPGIPGAVRVPPSRLRSSTKVRVPPDVQTVLCCSSRNQITSARTALSLRRKGISNVWVLEGGLKAWQKLDLPVTTELCSPADIVARFGVEAAE